MAYTGGMPPFLVTAAVTTVLLAVIGFVARIDNYRAAPFFLIPLVWTLYFIRRRVHLHPFHFALFASAVLMHCLGAFGWYRESPLPGSFDVYVHYYFAFVGTFLIHRALRHSYPLNAWQAAVATLIAVMGFGGIHEVVEYVSLLLLGEEWAMLKPSTSNVSLDTSRDLWNNFLGCLTALALIAVHRMLRRRGDTGGTPARGPEAA
jgi:uncharacterized membrane protein YjdF